MKKNTRLHLAFHGRIIDHIGIQMHHSPTGALAEAVSNAWDADATRVDISFDFHSDEKSEWSVTVRDNGNGMTKVECQEKFLNVGFNRRESEGGPSAKSPGGRPLMGRKGIGKFAGFGIARFIKVDTIGKGGTERTVFELDRRAIRRGDSYVSTDHLEIDAAHPEVPADREHGTEITLRDMKLSRRISSEQFGASLARRFLISGTSDDFEISVNGVPISNGTDASGIEMSFPRDLPEVVKEARRVSIGDGGWGTETMAGCGKIRWRVQFFKEPVENEEMRGITVFAHKKLAQRPFLFDLSDGLVGQTGPDNMSGKVVADWVDELEEDMISTERQRLYWDHPDLDDFRNWGQNLIKQLLSIWKDKLSEGKMRMLESKVERFSERLGQLGMAGGTARAALMKLAQIERLSLDQFQEMGSAILLACEKGRLGDLIEEISKVDEMDEGKLVEILTEAQIITTLHTAEVVYTKLQAIKGLETRVSQREIERTVRDCIAKNPWMISPRWETFAVEKSLSTICAEASKDAFKSSEDFNKRVDLILSAGPELLALEFMRPGLMLDYDHLDRFRRYVYNIRGYINESSGVEFNKITGYIIADKIAERRGIRSQLADLESNGLYAMDWMTLVRRAKLQWKEFLDHVKLRYPEDPRLENIGELK